MNQLILHRGIHDNKIKENTFLSISRALNHSKTKGVEFDIRLSKDQKIVVIHDHFIQRVSNGQGEVEKMTLKELQKYNYGSATFPQTIPTLDQILTISTSKIILVEIKCHHNEKIFANKIYETIQKDTHSNLYFMSFNKKVIRLLHKKDKNLKLGLLILRRKNIQYTDYYNFILSSIMSSKIAKKLIPLKKRIFFYFIHNHAKISQIKNFFPKEYHEYLYFITDHIHLI